MERELKLELLQDDVERLIGSPLVSSCCVEQPHTDRLLSTYFDTPDLAFRRAQLSLRVRRASDQYVQTLKTSGTQHGAFYERQEYECAIADGTPDLCALQDKVAEGTALGNLLSDSGLAERLNPIFVTDVERTVMLLRLPQGGEVELAVDRGEVRADKATVPIREVELEIQAGEPCHLFAFALQLLDAIPMRLSRASKGDHGYKLVADEPDVAARAGPLKLTAADSAEAAFQHIALNCLMQISGNERGVIDGASPESVHQMRVGLRRLRSALDIFRTVLTCPPGLQAELKWIADELGGARDWEVLAGTTLGAAFDGAPQDVGADAVVAAAKALAAENRQRAAQAVMSERYTRLILTLCQWLESKAWRDGADSAQRATLNASSKAFAETTLHKRQRLLRKRGRGMATLDEQQRHRARIAAKKLRYATEFFESLFPANKLRPYREHLSHLQDDLGWRNDMAVAELLLRGLGVEQEHLAVGCAYARGNIARRLIADTDALRRLWKRFKRARLPV